MFFARKVEVLFWVGFLGLGVGLDVRLGSNWLKRGKKSKKIRKTANVLVAAEGRASKQRRWQWQTVKRH